MNEFTIKDLENLTGIKAHTIRIWEQRYSFLSPNRTETNIRYYNNNELILVLKISLLHKYGFKISQLDKMSPDELNKKVMSLTQEGAPQQAIISKLIAHAIELEAEDFEDVLNQQIDEKCIEYTITNIIFPFYQKIGMLWATGHINPAQEHIVSNIIRQKLVAGIEKITVKANHEKTVLLFLPEYEFHELGLLYLNYLLRNRGIKVIYLGANVPLADIIFVAEKMKPDTLMVHLTVNRAQIKIEKYFSVLGQKLRDIPILVSGLFTTIYNKPKPSNIYFKNSPGEMIDFILPG